MTDRELLELAAKAAGLTLVDNGSDIEGRPWLWCPELGDHWDALTDDGDALRLAVKLGLSPEVHLDASQPLPWLRVAHRSRDARGVYSEQWQHVGPKDYGADPCAATRRAVVRAAAEIGRRL